MTKTEFRNLINGLSDSDMRTLRSIINGKLSKRTIDADQQAKMQLARKRKMI